VTRGAGIRRAITAAAAVLAADQATKALVRATIERGDELAILPGIDLVNTRNRGVAFGLFADGGAVLIAFAVVAILGIVVFLAVNAGRPHVWLPMGLLVGGAAGNLLDRVRHGAVTDFVDLPAWPAFNLADVAITGGVLGMLWVLEGPRARHRPG
jgi:signal peptidase II